MSQSIQTAVSAADDGSEVWVASGLYTDVHFINNRGMNGAIGIVVMDSAAILNNNIIRDNIGRLTGDSIGETVVGGGIVAFESQLILDGNTIVGNVALSRTAALNVEAYGGGLWAENSLITMTLEFRRNY